MTKTIGVTLTERIIAGLVIDHKLAAPLCSYPEGDEEDALVEVHAEGLVKLLTEQIVAVAGVHAAEIAAIGLAIPGLVRGGVIEEAPNLPQLKGVRIQELLAASLGAQGISAPVAILNDADGVAAGVAATRKQMDKLTRVWTLGVGIGYGHYPFAPGVWEGGHTVVSLDEREHFCGCGGRGHMEGIMGHRAMRLRFLDMEPEEVFAAAKAGDVRCFEFRRLWHKALAAATANSVHYGGPGRFYLTGLNVRFVDLRLLQSYMSEMVKMSPLQSYSFEIVADDTETRVIGSAVAAEQLIGRC
jgi:predicted NBD/HSP70 family sugar kinase